MNHEDIIKILNLHQKWLNNEPTGVRANLYGANLYVANLYGANLARANLCGANLARANLCGANLYGANLYGANLARANLCGANLYGANLARANLCGANLCGANLYEANLKDTKLPHFQICPTNDSFTAWKKLSNGVICKLRVTKNAKRTSSLISRKCRAEYVRVLEGEGVSWKDQKTKYTPGKITRADSYNDDPRVECTNGIHFFMTREEATEF